MPVCVCEPGRALFFFYIIRTYGLRVKGSYTACTIIHFYEAFLLNVLNMASARISQFMFASS